MNSKLKMLAIAAAMAAGTSSAALAQVCPAGTFWNGAACQPGAAAYAPSNPVSGAAAGGAAGAAAGGAAAGPVGAAVGGAVGTATGAAAGTAAGTANMAAGAPVAATPAPVAASGSSTPPAAGKGVCPAGEVNYKGSCFPDQPAAFKE